MSQRKGSETYGSEMAPFREPRLLSTGHEHDDR